MRMLATGGEREKEEDLVTYGGQDACQVRIPGENEGFGNWSGKIVYLFQVI